MLETIRIPARTALVVCATAVVVLVAGLAAAAEFNVIDLGTATGLGATINNFQLDGAGRISGSAGDATLPFLWDGTTRVDLPGLGQDAAAYGMSSTGLVVGSATDVTTGHEHAVVWSNAGSVLDIHGLGDESRAYGANVLGQAVGSVFYPGGAYRGFFWDGTTMSDIGTYPGGTNSEGFAVNSAGDIAVTGNVPPALFQRALLKSSSGWTDLGTLGGDQSTAWNLNEAGDIVGDAEPSPGAPMRAFLWHNGSMTDLLTLGGVASTARGINNRGQVVGYSYTGTEQHGFLYDCRGTMLDLNDLVSSPLTIVENDYRINDAGQVTAFGRDNVTGEYRALLLDPLPVCGNCRVTPSSGEQCDDGNTNDGDGCSSTCQIETSAPAVGTGAASTGEAATPSQPVQAAVTSPSGGGISITRTAVSGTPSTSTFDVLSVGFDVTAPVETSASPLAFTFLLEPSLVPAGVDPLQLDILRNDVPVADCSNPSLDVAAPDPCVKSRTRLANGNIEIRALSSAASRWKLAAAPCPSEPVADCRVAPVRKSSLTVKQPADDAKSLFIFKWSKGAATTVGDFGNPLLPVGSGYRACVYDQPTTTARLVTRLDVAPGGTCKGKNCWKASSHGFVYRDPNAASDGVLSATLKSGAAGKAQVQLKGKGSGLPGMQLPWTSPVVVQVHGPTGTCFAATFASPKGVPDPSVAFKASSTN